MAKEIERAGIPTALVTAMVSVAESVGTPRIVRGQAIVHPLGDPSLPPEQERALRRRLVELALQAISTPVEGPRIFTLPPQAPERALAENPGDRWLH